MRIFRTILVRIVRILSLPFRAAFARHPTESAEPKLTAEAIMARVATNQDLAEAERAQYIYVQHAHIVSRKGSTVMCEEITDSRVTPSPKGSEQQQKLNGRLLQKQAYVSYTSHYPARTTETNPIEVDRHSLSIDIGDDDREPMDNTRSNLTNDKSRDGPGAHLFPLTSSSQSGYLFQLVRRERTNDCEVFHITFQPRVKDEYGWKGDAYIGARAYQPVVIITTVARKVPVAVRTLLGTSLPRLGFKVVYAPLPDGTWFPVSFGLSLDFEKTHVSSKILTAKAPANQ